MADQDLGIDVKSFLDPQQGQDKTDGEMIRDLYKQEPEQAGRKNSLAGQTMLLTGQDSDPTSYPVLFHDTDKERTHNKAVENRLSSVDENAQQVLQATLETDPDNFEATAKALRDRFIETESRATDPLKAEREVVDSITSLAPISINEKTKEQEVVRLAALNTVAKLLEDQGVVDKIFDFGGLMVPFGITKDQIDLINNKFDWTNAVSIDRFILDFQRLPADRKLKELPALTEAILEATGTIGVSDQNILKASGLLLSLVSAEGAEDQAFERNLDILFGILDAGGAAAGAAKAIMGASAVRLAKKGNLVRKVKELGDTPRAANINIQAIKDPQASKLAGISRQEAATNALPIQRDSVRPEWTGDLAPEVSKQLNALNQKADGIVHDFMDESIFIKEGLLRKQEKEKVIQSTIDKLSGAGTKRDVMNEGIHIDNIEVVSMNEQGFVLSYDMKKLGVTETTTPDLRVKQKYTWQRDQATGNFNETVESAKHKQGFEYGVSSAAWSHTGEGGDFLATFKSASNLADLAAASQSVMLDLLKEANKTRSGFLSPNGRKRVNAIEIAGDEFLDPDTGIRGKTYSPSELIAGVDTPEGTVRLSSPAEQEAYYKHRIFADTMFQLENNSARRQLEILGFNKHVNIGGGQDVIGRTFDRANDAKSSIRGKIGNLWDERRGESVPLSDELIDELYDDGYQLVRTLDDTPLTKFDGVVEHFDYVTVKKGEAKSLPQKVLHYKDGYVPKINKGVEYLVKEQVPGYKAGATNFTRAVTHRFFASKKDAEAYRQARIKEFLEENVDVTPEQADLRFSTVADREMTPQQRLKEASGSSGGLFTGARSSHDIATGLKGINTERVSPLEAFQRNAQHIGSLVARNEWRLGEEQRWLNTVEAQGFKNEGFEGTNLPPTPTGNALNHQRNLIKQWNGIPTKDESFFEGVMQNMHDWMLTQGRRVPGFKDKESIKSLLWLKHTEPAAAMKTAVFHLALGVWNPAQLFVQGSAAAVALSRFPRTAPQALPYAFRLAATDRMRAAGTADRIAKTFSDADTPIFDEVRLAWERSGLRESVRQNADLNAADSYGVMSLNSLKRLSDASMSLYRAGELFNRRVSFTASYLNWKRMNPGKVPGNDELKAIKADANLSMLELNHANRAMWQGGPDAGTFRNILGVMTQFQQVGAKSTELLIKGPARGGFSTEEKMKILLAQFGLWGAAGIPLANAIVGEATEWTGAEMTPETQEAWNQGILGSLIVYGLGAEVEVAPRLAPFGQLEQLVRDLMFDDVPLAERMLGVAGSIGGRVGEAFNLLHPMVTSSFERGNVEWSDILRGASVIAEVPSSTRGMVKAYIMSNMHKILDRHGNVVVSENFSTETELAAALGFRPISEVETRQMQLANLDAAKLVQETTDVALDLYLRYIQTAESDPESGAKLRSALNVMFAALGNPQLEQDVRASMDRKIMAEGSLRDRELKKFFERTIPSKIDEGATVLRNSFFSNAVSTRAVVQPFEKGDEE